MLIYFLLFYCAIFLSPEVSAIGEHDIKRGEYPFMAFLYYPDDTLLDESGSRFLRGAILIHESWLISASAETKSSVHVGFPRKTLLARLGATHIDANFTLNEDEDEQEREIIQIVKPAHHKKTEWWLTDINLLKTLLPFNLTSTVGITTFHPRREDSRKCNILVFSPRYHNRSDEKLLMKLHVNLYSPTKEDCGTNFNSDTMICGGESDENKHSLYNTMFCDGNRGGPLICGGYIIGLQTYIDDCKPPFLYQLLSSWENLITCGMEEKCAEEKCSNVCTALFKDEDAEKSSTKKAAIHSVSSYFIDLVEHKNGSSTILIPNATREITSSSTASTSSEKTTTVHFRAEEEEESITTTTSSSEHLNVTASNATVAAPDPTKPETNESTTVRHFYPGYYLQTTENVDVSDTPASMPASNLTNTSKPVEKSDMAAEASVDITTETFINEKAHTDSTVAKVDIFKDPVRTYTKYEPNPEPMTSRARSDTEEDSAEGESVEVGITVTPRKPTTTSTHTGLSSQKPGQGGSTSTGNDTATSPTSSTFWPIQKIASAPHSSLEESGEERESRMELQQQKARQRRYRTSAANKSELWSLMLFLNVLAFNCI